MDIPQLQYAKAVADAQNFSKAAKNLHITQSGLSQQIQRLESELGFALFARSHKGAVLTSQGEQFLLAASDVLQSFKALQAQANLLRSSICEAPILVGNSTIYRPGAADAIALFISLHPELNIQVLDIWEGEMAELLLRGDLDVGIFGIDEEYDDLSGILTIPIQKERIVAVISTTHPDAYRTELPVEEIWNHKLIYASPQTGVRRILRRSLEERGLTLPDGSFIQSVETRLHYVARGMGITFSMDATLPKPLRDDVRAVPLSPALIRQYAVGVSQSMQQERPELVQTLKEFVASYLKSKK